MDRTRIDRDLGESNDRTPALDRIWAATRPAELRADDFDRIWAEVQRAYDARPAVLAMSRADRSRRSIALVAFGLLQAAAVLVVAWALNRPVVTDRPPVVRGTILVPPTLKIASVEVAQRDVEADETLILNIDGGRVTDASAPARRRLAARDSLAMLDLPEHTPIDLLNRLESLSP